MFVLLAAVYIVAGRLSLLLAFANANASPVWPPTGLAIGALLVLGLRAWPAIAVGAFIVNLTNSGDVVAAFLIAVGNTLEAVAAAWLTLRYARGRAAFNSTRNVLRFVAISANASTIAASIGTVTVVGIGLGPAADAGNIWLTWWLGDTVGAIVVAPLIVLWERRPLLSDVSIRIGEMAALIAALGLRSEEHTSELQSQSNLVCRLLLEKKNKRLLEEKNIKADEAYLGKIVELVKDRCTLVTDFYEQSWFFFQRPKEYDVAAVKPKWSEEKGKFFKEFMSELNAI